MKHFLCFVFCWFVGLFVVVVFLGGAQLSMILKINETFCVFCFLFVCWFVCFWVVVVFFVFSCKVKYDSLCVSPN